MVIISILDIFIYKYKMFIKEKEFILIKITTKKQASSLSLKLNKDIQINDMVNVHWLHLKSTKNRILFIEVKCDDCGLIHQRRIRDLNENKNEHYCRNCFNKGNRNGMYGKPCSENSKIALRKWIETNGNPFTWETTKKKISEKKPWIKARISNLGRKVTTESKIKMSNSALLAFKEGRREPTIRWGKTKINQYRELDYQSSYELNFIKKIEELNLFDKLERGPKIKYVDYDTKHRTYFSDFKLKDSNLVFEIKSTYIWNKNLKTNLLKKEAAEKFFNYHLILDNNFLILDKILLNYEK